MSSGEAHEVYLLMLRQAAGTHARHAVMLGFSAAAHPTKYTCSYSGQLLTLAPCSMSRHGLMQSYSSSQLVPTPSRADAYPMHKLYQHTGENP